MSTALCPMGDARASFRYLQIEILKVPTDRSQSAINLSLTKPYCHHTHAETHDSSDLGGATNITGIRVVHTDKNVELDVQNRLNTYSLVRR